MQPVERLSGVVSESLEEGALRPVVSLAERVHRVNLAGVVGQPVGELPSCQAPEDVFPAEPTEDLGGASSPVVDVTEDPAADLAQVGQVVAWEDRCFPQQDQRGMRDLPLPSLRTSGPRPSPEPVFGYSVSYRRAVGLKARILAAHLAGELPLRIPGYPLMARRRYLVAYDIRDGRRLRAVAGCAQGYGTRIQYPVFVCDLSGREKFLMRGDVESRMRLSEDSMMIVDLGAAGDWSGFLFLGHYERLPSGGAVIV